MAGKKYGKFLTILLVISIIAFLGLGGYFIYDMVSRDSVNKQAEDAFDEFQRRVEELNRQNAKNNEIVNVNLDNNINNEITNSDDNPDTPGNNSNGYGTGGNGGGTSYYNKNYNLQSKYQGYTMLGTIQIPRINIKVPILKEVSVDALNRATCLIYGNLNEEGNAVIIGHNNRNGTFFSNLKRLKAGDAITITDYNGEIVEYKVYNVFQTTPDDVSFYNRDTNGLREITLSTCTDNDDTKRIIVLAKES